MNRFKLIFLLIIFGLVGVLLQQNRELLSLKLFCPDVTSQSCLYTTPSLPLAVWLGLFTIAGILSSLLWQFCNRLASASPTPKTRDRPVKNQTQPKPRIEDIRPQTAVNPNKTTTLDWEESQSEDWEGDRGAQTKQGRERFEPESTVYSVRDRPQDLPRRDSTYSYKFREAKPKQSTSQKTTSKNQTEEVYDVNYRTVKPASDRPINLDKDDDEEWI